MPESSPTDFLSQAARSVVLMRKIKDQRTNQTTTGASQEFDPFSDPVLYLRGLGIEAELVETLEAKLPSAA
jgi:hypothetical protein